MTAASRNLQGRDSSLLALQLSGILITVAAVLQIVLQLVAGSQWSVAVGRPTFLASIIFLASAAIVLSLPQIGGIRSTVTDRAGVIALRVFAGLLVLDFALFLFSPSFLPSDLGAAVVYSYVAQFIDLLVLVAAALAVVRLSTSRQLPQGAVLIAGGTVAWYAAAGLFAVALPFVAPNAPQELLITLHVTISMVGPLLTLGTGLFWIMSARNQRGLAAA